MVILPPFLVKKPNWEQYLDYYSYKHLKDNQIGYSIFQRTLSHLNKLLSLNDYNGLADPQVFALNWFLLGPIYFLFGLK